MIRVALYAAVLIALGTPAAAQTYTPMTVAQIKHDGAKMNGKKVEIKGLVSPSGNDLNLLADQNDNDPLPVKAGALPEDQRDSIFSKCLGTGCRAVVRGTVSTARMMKYPAIVADSVEPPPH